MYEVTVQAQSLLNSVPHESDGTLLYTYYHEGRWLCTTSPPVTLGTDAHGCVLEEIQVEAVYDDAVVMLQARRENGYYSDYYYCEECEKPTRHDFLPAKRVPSFRFFKCLECNEKQGG